MEEKDLKDEVERCELLFIAAKGDMAINAACEMSDAYRAYVAELKHTIETRIEMEKALARVIEERGERIKELEEYKAMYLGVMEEKKDGQDVYERLEPRDTRRAQNQLLRILAMVAPERADEAAEAAREIMEALR